MMVNATPNGERMVNANVHHKNRDSHAGFWQKLPNGERVNTSLRLSPFLTYSRGHALTRSPRSPYIYKYLFYLIITLVLGGEHPRSPLFTMFTTPRGPR